MSEKGYVLVVDDKQYGRDAGVAVFSRLDYPESHILVSKCGDEALDTYTTLQEQGHTVDLVLTDYHMDVSNRVSELGLKWNKKPEILDGYTLANRITGVNAAQKVIIVSGASADDIMKKVPTNNIFPVLYKRKPDDEKFGDYVDAIRAFIQDGRIGSSITTRLLHVRMKAGNLLR